VARDLVVESMDDGVIVIDMAGRISDANPAAEWMVAMPRAKMLTLSPARLFDQQPRALQLYYDLFALGDQPDKRDETTLIHKTGDIVVEMRLIDLRDATGEPRGHVILLQNITERNRMEVAGAWRMAELTALRDIDWKITGTLDIDDVLEIALSAAIRMSSADAGFISMIEGDKQKVLQISGAYEDKFKGEMLSATEGVVGRVARTKKPERVLDIESDPDYIAGLPDTRAEIAIPLLARDNLIGVLNLETRTPAHFTREVFDFVKLLAGRIAVALENASLYTESQKHIEKLQELYEQVSALEQIKTDMIRIASHDLVSPLSTLMGYLSLMQTDSDQLSESHNEWVNTMMGLSDRMENLIHEILSIERIEETYEPEIVDIATLVSETIENHKLDVTDKSQDVKLSLPAEPIFIEGDPALLREVVTNLLNNAIKYTPSGGELQVSLARHNGSVVFEIEDNGYGIPEDKQSQLFQPFYRVVSDKTASIKGTGLGLHLVKNVVERHNGHIRFKSEYGKGSTFGFELPLMAE
jgi:PAS domain S-box-containing protein